jgi:hypothetical protein
LTTAAVASRLAVALSWLTVVGEGFARVVELDHRGGGEPASGGESAVAGWLGGLSAHGEPSRHAELAAGEVLRVAATELGCRSRQ